MNRLPRCLTSALLGVLLVAPLAAQTAKTPSTKAPSSRGRVERPVPFAPGEVLTYDVAWSTFLVAGTATMGVREKRSETGSAAYYVVAEGQPISLVQRLYSVYYKADAWLDAYALAPRRSSIYSREGNTEVTKTTTFDHRAGSGRYEVRASSPRNESLRLPSGTLDPLSAVYALRAMPLVPGQSFRLSVTESGELYTVVVKVGAREQVRSGLGGIAAWRLTLSAVDTKGAPAGSKALALWISDDGRRLPVRLQAELPVGTFDLVLRTAEGTLPTGR